MAPTDPVIAAYAHSSHHRAELEASACCGCFFCLAIFAPGEIEHWLNEGDGTAFCPRCMIDAVLGSASGYPITEKFLQRLQRHWFSGPAGVGS